MPQNYSPIIIYHATYTTRPDDMKNRLHDVHPDVMEAQVNWLKEYYDIVSVDDWFAAKSKKGLACVTFDDAYDCTFTEALPRLIELSIPATVFLNGSSFDGKVFWRDKIRLLINGGHVADFLSFTLKEHGHTLGLTEEKFYRLTKSPANNSKLIAEAIDRYMKHSGLENQLRSHCVQFAEALTSHPLVSYGNHTMNHYVLSSITDEEQQHEIVDNQKWLDTMPIRRSNIFAIPFGGLDTINTTTGIMVKQAGNTGALYCQNRLNTLDERLMLGEVPAADRLLAPATLQALQEIIATPQP